MTAYDRDADLNDDTPPAPRPKGFTRLRHQGRDVVSIDLPATLPTSEAPTALVQGLGVHRGALVPLPTTRRRRAASMNMLALDLGTRSGWCLREDGLITSGVQTFDVRRGESPGMRYIRLQRWLNEMGARVHLVIFEAQHNRGGAASEIAAGFATHLQQWCARRRIEHTAVHTATLKKFACGSGRAEKSMVIEAVRRKWAPGCRTDDEADAIALLYYGIAEYDMT